MNRLDFVRHSSNPELARAVINQMGGWQSFKECAPDIAQHGIAQGFCGFTYYADNAKFAKLNKRVILAHIENFSNDMGQGLLECIQGFGCLGKDYSLEEIGQAIYAGTGEPTSALSKCSSLAVLNSLAWYAAEEIAREYDDKRG